ncbi:MAG: YbaB/EbfC family nucleoid-associated protein [Erysipelotrichales bacterium]|nr:YbaB/EbfC family nucleoid-associated protein [Erysipelotrichales bacterium]
MFNPQMLNKLKKMQKDMEDAQKQIEETEFIGTSGGGAVVIKALGSKEIIKVTIDKELDDIEMLEDLILTAVNDCIRRIEKETEKALAPYQQGALGGLF